MCCPATPPRTAPHHSDPLLIPASTQMPEKPEKPEKRKAAQEEGEEQEQQAVSRQGWRGFGRQLGVHAHCWPPLSLR